jgi:hypothetical protein
LLKRIFGTERYNVIGGKKNYIMASFIVGNHHKMVIWPRYVTHLTKRRIALKILNKKSIGKRLIWGSESR